jgi:ABC-type sugar transport system permease subunit
MKESQKGYLLILPSLMVMALFTLYPLLDSLRIAFTDKSVLKDDFKYVGLDNFVRLLSDDIFWISLYHSLTLTFVVILLQFVLGLILAVAMQQELPGMALFKSIIMASWVIPVAATVIMFKFMAQPDIGLINLILKFIGLGNFVRYWFGDPNGAAAFIILLHLWRNVPFYGIAFLAAMQAIPRSYYEAAEIDGANVWDRFVHITLPGIRSMIIVMVTIHVLWTFNNFDFVYLATGGGPVNRTEVLPVYVYRQSWNSYALGYGASAGAIMLAIMLIYFTVYLRIYERRVISR